MRHFFFSAKWVHFPPSTFQLQQRRNPEYKRLKNNGCKYSWNKQKDKPVLVSQAGNVAERNLKYQFCSQPGFSSHQWVLVSVVLCDCRIQNHDCFLWICGETRVSNLISDKELFTASSRFSIQAGSERIHSSSWVDVNLSIWHLCATQTHFNKCL